MAMLTSITQRGGLFLKDPSSSMVLIWALEEFPYPNFGAYVSTIYVAWTLGNLWAVLEAFLRAHEPAQT